MPLHAEPANTAEKLARHLETEYALQLDAFRHRHLVSELQGFGAEFVRDYLSATPEEPVESDESYEASAALQQAQQQPESPVKTKRQPRRKRSATGEVNAEG